MTKHQILKQFLNEKSKLIKSKLMVPFYNNGMEIHVNVAQDLGIVQGKSYTNSDGEFWYNFRLNTTISENQNLNFSPDRFESIGLSGWNFKDQKSYWVGFDFDSIIGHKKGLSDQEINKIINHAKDCKFITLVKSTSGRGIHIYIPIDQTICPIIETRKQHSLLARSILSTISGILSFDFKSKADTAGTILWVWSRKGNQAESFEVIKAATESFRSIPPDWAESKRSKKIQDIAANIKSLELDEEQQILIKWFANSNNTWWWDAELNMLVCHTFNLAQAHTELKLKGVFFTNARGREAASGDDQNCFMFPLKNGAWIVRRHNPGCKEHEYWKSDSSGWTFCYFNKTPTLEDIAPLFNGQLSSKKEFIFPNSEAAGKVIQLLNPNLEFGVTQYFTNRQFKLKYLEGSKVAIFFDRLENEHLEGWIENKKQFEKVITIIEEEVEIRTPDELVRHVVGNNVNAGWFIFSRNEWNGEPKDHVMLALSTLGYNPSQINEMLGKCILNPWLLINKPFESEYPGNREWNKFAPQLMYEPKEGDWQAWQKILVHIGKGLDDAVKENSWCTIYGIKDGATYLKLWVASVFQFPSEPLPYLFLYGPQLSGKSSLHEALKLLVTKGVEQADTALTNSQGFNKELAGAIICAVEETDLSRSKVAYDRIKSWVTSDFISIHEKRITPFQLKNTTHWIQTANSSSYCPITIGDTRIIMIYVDKPKVVFPKEKFKMELKEQAPAFLHEILINTELPPPIDRLRIPLIETGEKYEEQLANANPVERFILDNIFIRNGLVIEFPDFVAKFHLWLNAQGQNTMEWNKNKISRAIPQTESMPVKGRYGELGNIHLGNCTFDQAAKPKNFKLIKSGDKLIEYRDN